MATQTKSVIQSDLKTVIDVTLISFGVLAGSITALLGLWLWFDYQADPTHSQLALLSGQLAGLLPAALRQYFGAQTRLMGLPLTGQTSAYWYMARAGGYVAYFLMWLSVVWGLVLSTKITKKLVPAQITYGLHEFLSLLAILFALLHAAVLLGDEYIKFNVFHLLIPFSSPYEPLWTGLGTITLYLSIALTVSFYLRQQIGQKLWRAMHYLTFAAYLLALLHGIMAGSDSRTIASLLIYWGTGFTVLFLTYYRLLSLTPKTRR